MHTNSYAVASAVIPEEICDEIIRIGDMLDNRNGEIASRNATSTLTRLSTVSWFSPQQAEKYDLNFEELYDTIFQAFSQIVYDAGWGDWEITRSQAFQYTKYGPGGHYDWHPDAHKYPYSDENNQEEFGLIRKLSMVILLNDYSEYEGGSFLLENHQTSGPHEIWHRIVNINLEPSYNKKGTMIVFPSHLWHKVEPLKKGLRYSLVGWFIGPPFK